MNNTPLISVVTATFNAGDELLKTIQSIQNQSFTDFEFIVIDGGSTDNTLEIIKNYYPGTITHYISEPDKGIYDAWNKGLYFAKGEWIGFIGAGDLYNPDALSKYANFITGASTELEYISSRVEIVSDEGKVLEVKGSQWECSKFKKYMNTAHVGSLHSRKLYDTYGKYDISYKIAGDYELLMRPLGKLRAGYFNEITAKMLYGGTSMTSVSLKNYLEDFRIKSETGKVPVLKARIDNYLSFLRAKVRYFLNERGIFFHYNK